MFPIEVEQLKPGTTFTSNGSLYMKLAPNPAIVILNLTLVLCMEDYSVHRMPDTVTVRTTDIDDNKTPFQCVDIGEIFEDANGLYLKIPGLVTESCNALDLHNFQYVYFPDDCPVSLLTCELTVSPDYK